MLISCVQPAACQLVFFFGAFWASIQAYMIGSPKVRDFVGIQPLPPKEQKENGTITLQRAADGTYSSASPEGEPSTMNPIVKTINDLKEKWQQVRKMQQQRSQKSAQQARIAKAKAYEQKRRKEIDAQKSRR